MGVATEGKGKERETERNDDTKGTEANTFPGPFLISDFPFPSVPKPFFKLFWPRCEATEECL